MPKLQKMPIADFINKKTKQEPSDEQFVLPICRNTTVSKAIKILLGSSQANEITKHYFYYGGSHYEPSRNKIENGDFTNENYPVCLIFSNLKEKFPGRLSKIYAFDSGAVKRGLLRINTQIPLYDFEIGTTIISINRYIRAFYSNHNNYLKSIYPNSVRRELEITTCPVLQTLYKIHETHLHEETDVRTKKLELIFHEVYWSFLDAAVWPLPSTKNQVDIVDGIIKKVKSNDAANKHEENEFFENYNRKMVVRVYPINTKPGNSYDSPEKVVIKTMNFVANKFAKEFLKPNTNI